MYSNLVYVTFLFYLYSLFFYSPRWRFVLQTTLFFVLLFYLFYLSSCRKDQFTVLSLKFGTQDFTDRGGLKFRWTRTGLSLWFCPHKWFCYITNPDSPQFI